MLSEDLRDMAAFFAVCAKGGGQMEPGMASILKMQAEAYAMRAAALEGAAAPPVARGDLPPGVVHLDGERIARRGGPRPNSGGAA